MTASQPTPWMENDELARTLTEAGWKWQLYVARFFEAHGFEVDVPEYSWRNSREEIKDYLHTWDLKICDQRIEVKSRDLAFDTYWRTFPWERALVDTVHNYEAHEVKPMAYIYVSQHTGAMLTTPGSVEARDAWWEKKDAFDHVRKINDTFYTVGREHLDPITKLLARLKELQ